MKFNRNFIFILGQEIRRRCSITTTTDESQSTRQTANDHTPGKTVIVIILTLNIVKLGMTEIMVKKTLNVLSSALIYGYLDTVTLA